MISNLRRYLFALVLVFVPPLLARGKKMDNQSPKKIIEVKQGDLIKLGNLEAKLITFRTNSSDYTEEKKKSSAYFEMDLGKGKETIEVGGYYEHAPFINGYVLSLLSSSIDSAKIEIKQSRLILNAEKFDAKLKNHEIKIGKSVNIKGLDLSVMGFYYDGYQKSLIGHLKFRKGDVKNDIHNSGPINFLNYYVDFKTVQDDYQVIVRPVAANEIFKLHKGESISFDEPAIQISLNEQKDEGGFVRLLFTIKTSGKESKEEMKLYYTQESIDYKDIPAGKHPELNDKMFSGEKSKTKIEIEGYVLENDRKFDVMNEHTTNIFKLVKK